MSSRERQTKKSQDKHNGCDHDHDHGTQTGHEDPIPGLEGFRDGASMSDEELDRLRPVGQAIPAEDRQAFFSHITESAEIQSCLDQIEAARGDLDFDITWSSRGSFHQSGALALDRRRSAETLVGSIMHELEHLRTKVCGERADIRDDDKEAYVTSKVEEEIRCHVQAYIGLLQVGTMSANTKGYNDFLDHLQADHPNLMACYMDPVEESGKFEEIRELASDWLRDHYQNSPDWKTSTGGDTYYDHYGNAWDRQHNK